MAYNGFVKSIRREQMVYPHFMRVVNTNDTKFLLWNTGNYRYRIEIFDRKDMKLLSAINYDKPYEFVSSEFDAIVSKK